MPCGPTRFSPSTSTARRRGESIAAPFKRRALAAGAAGGRIYALGGLKPDAGPQLRVDVLDTASGAWGRGPDLPRAGSLQGFGVAAASYSDRLLVSQADGKVYRLDRRRRVLGAGGDSRYPPLHAPDHPHRRPGARCRRRIARRAPRDDRRRAHAPGSAGFRERPSRVRGAGRAFWAAGTPTSAGPPGCR